MKECKRRLCNPLDLYNVDRVSFFFFFSSLAGITGRSKGWNSWSTGGDLRSLEALDELASYNGR